MTETKPIWDVDGQIRSLEAKIAERKNIESKLEAELNDHKAQTAKLEAEVTTARKEKMEG